MEDKYYYYLNNDTDLQSAVSKFLRHKRSNPNTKFIVVISKEEILNYDVFGDFNFVIEAMKQFGLTTKDIQINVENPTHKYTPEEWKTIKENASLLQKQGFELGFEDQEKTWTIREVEIANSKIQSTAEEIKKANLTPAETLLAVYMKVSSRKYTYESEDEHFSQSRSVYGILNSDRIVCAGYAELMQAILDEIGNDNIKVFQNIVSVKRGDKTEYHQNLVVHIKDDKYNVDGWYYLDPTWDNKEEKLNYFLVPIQDIAQIKDTIIEAESYTKPRGERAAAKIRANSKGIGKNTTYMHKDPVKYVSFSANKLVFSEPMLDELLKQDPNFMKELNKSYYNLQKRDILGSISKAKTELELLGKARDCNKKYGVNIGSQAMLNQLLRSGDLEHFASILKDDKETNIKEGDDFYNIVYILRDELEKDIEVETKIVKKIIDHKERKGDLSESEQKTLQETKNVLSNLQKWNDIADGIILLALLSLQDYDSPSYINPVLSEDTTELLYEIVLGMKKTDPDKVMPTEFISKYFKKYLDANFVKFDELIEENIQNTRNEIRLQKLKYNDIVNIPPLSMKNILNLAEMSEGDAFFLLKESSAIRKYSLSAFYEYMKDHSKPIPKLEMLLMLTNTFKKMHPEMSIDEAYDRADKIMDRTKSKASRVYKKDATNCFMEDNEKQ